MDKKTLCNLNLNLAVVPACSTNDDQFQPPHSYKKVQPAQIKVWQSQLACVGVVRGTKMKIREVLPSVSDGARKHTNKVKARNILVI